MLSIVLSLETHLIYGVNIMTTNLKNAFSNTLNFVKEMNIAKTFGVVSLSFIMGAPSHHHHEEHGNLRERRREQGETVGENTRIRTRSCSISNGGGSSPDDDNHEELVEIVSTYRGRDAKTPTLS